MSQSSSLGPSPNLRPLQCPSTQSPIQNLHLPKCWLNMYLTYWNNSWGLLNLARLITSNPQLYSTITTMFWSKLDLHQLKIRYMAKSMRTVKCHTHMWLLKISFQNQEHWHSARSPTSKLRKPFFMDLALYRGALSCWNRKGLKRYA